jgi:hypothetical protein
MSGIGNHESPLYERWPHASYMTHQMGKDKKSFLDNVVKSVYQYILKAKLNG